MRHFIALCLFIRHSDASTTDYSTISDSENSVCKGIFLNYTDIIALRTNFYIVPRNSKTVLTPA
ncbi:MAG: hypothetical protein JNM36_00090 [Chitinophagales bacterium]|nr:hypothetical protein [Chitinophagales bacterium]